MLSSPFIPRVPAGAACAGPSHARDSGVAGAIRGQARRVAWRQLAPGNRVVECLLEEAQRFARMRQCVLVKLGIDEVHLQE